MQLNRSPLPQVTTEYFSLCSATQIWRRRPLNPSYCTGPSSLLPTGSSWTGASPQTAAAFCLAVLDTLPIGLLSTKNFEYKKIVDMHDVSSDQAARLAKMVVQKLDPKIQGIALSTSHGVFVQNYVHLFFSIISSTKAAMRNCFLHHMKVVR